MKRKIVNILLALTLISTSLTGCGSTSFVANDVTSYPLVNALTEQEVIDYYAKALEYDAIISRNVEEHETTYETREVDGAKAEKLKSLVAQAETILSKNEYAYSIENSNIVDENVYNYVKASIDNYYLTNGNIQSIKGALGYYFVDVVYNIHPRELGTFNQMTPLIGLDGVFQTSADSGYNIDESYIVTITKKLNEYYIENKIKQAAVYDSAFKQFMIVEGGDPAEALKAIAGINTSTSTPIVNTEETVEGTDGTESTEQTPNTEGTSTEEVLKDEEGNVIDADGNVVYTATEYEELLNNQTQEGDTTTEETPVISGGMDFSTVVETDRQITLDCDLINSLAGTSLTQKAFLPDLNLVYTKPAEQGTISGYGIYSAGGNGLKVFDFDRNNIEGTITLRYVFKDAIDGTDSIIGTNIYIVEEEVTTGFNVSSQTLVIPDFLYEQFEIMVDRSDRVIANCDLSGLMSGNIYQDMGVAVLRGYRELNTNTLKYLSTIRQVIERDYETNSYLMEIETTVQEGAKSSDVYGTYRDKYYIVIQQQGTDFVIVDSLRTSRDLVKEPSINPDDAITKRLVALNLAGEVTDEAKTNVNKLLTDWYTAGSNRLLHAKDSSGNFKTIVVDGQEIQLERGMYDCFQTDASMLATSDLEYMQSQVRTQLDKYGTGIGVKFNGIVTEWIGGAENQVEFTTEELITYNGKNEGHYMQVYYLVSNMNDVWVVDERTILDERDVQGNELSNIVDRIQ